MKICARTWAIASGVFCLAFFITGYILEYVYFYSPCILCYVQRYLFLLIALIILPTILGLRARALTALIFCFSILVSSFGIGIGAKHLQLQAMPPEQAPSCSMATHQVLESNNVLKVFEHWLNSDAECTLVQTFLGINLVHWSLVGFLLVLAMLLQGLKVSLIRKR